MLKVLFLTIFLSFQAILWAQDTTAQRSEAISLYKQAQYEKSYELFSKLYLRSLNDVTLNFLLGRSAYETGRFEIALAAFERVNDLDPTNVRNKLEIARTQFKLGMYEDARIGFDQVLRDPNLPDTVRINIELFISQIDGRLQKSFFYGNVRLGGLYDSNVNYGAFDDTYNLPNFGSFSSTDETSDYAYEAEISLVHLYDIGEKNGFQIRNSFDVYHREYDTLEEYDLTYLSYVPSLIYQDLKTIYELNLNLDHMSLHHESYLNLYALTPKFTYKLDANTRFIGSYMYTRKYFQLDIDQDRDADNNEFSLSLQKLWDSSYLTIEMSMDFERKKQGQRVDVDFNRYRVKLDYAKQFYPTYTAKFDAEVKTREYQDYSNLFQNHRTDDGYRTGLSLVKRFTPTIYFETKATYERTWSTQSIYAYKKHTLNLNLNKSF